MQVLQTLQTIQCRKKNPLVVACITSLAGCKVYNASQASFFQDFVVVLKKNTSRNKQASLLIRISSHPPLQHLSFCTLARFH